jgi:SCY1-like protein 2
MATLSVQEAMGFKVDREAVATLVLPQLWSMSIGPCKSDAHSPQMYRGLTSSLTVLNLEQFQRFMDVIRKLGDRVEKEHNQFLRDSQRIGSQSSAETDGSTGVKSVATNLDFESLVGGANGAAHKVENKTERTKTWDDDVWESIFTNDGVRPCSFDFLLSLLTREIQRRFQHHRQYHDIL